MRLAPLAAQVHCMAPDRRAPDHRAESHLIVQAFHGAAHQGIAISAKQVPRLVGTLLPSERRTPRDTHGVRLRRSRSAAQRAPLALPMNVLGGSAVPSTGLEHTPPSGADSSPCRMWRCDSAASAHGSSATRSVTSRLLRARRQRSAGP